MKIILFFLLAFGVQAETKFSKISFVDQFEEKIELTDEVEYIIFSKDKVASDIVNESFKELNFFDLHPKKIIYVADISKMPAFVTKLFAMPKMKKYKYKIALDKEGTLTKEWPFKDEQISLIKVNKLKEENQKFIANKENFKEELSKIIGQKLGH